MRLVPLGDSAWLAELGAQPDATVAEAVRRLVAGLKASPLKGVESVVPSYTTVAVHFVPEGVKGAGDAGTAVAAWIGRVWAKGGSPRSGRSREVVLPVCYGGDHGPDLDEVARVCGLTPAEVIRRHARETYAVRAVGFSPGFPYLAGLPAALGVPRRATPRTRVRAGSVAIGGSQTGIYPSATPGGWNLIGRCPHQLFNPMGNPPSLLRAGDRVRFEQIAPEAFERLTRSEPAPVTPPAQTADPTFTVLRPGLLTTVQDLGRPNHQDIGVSPGGAVDTQALRVANLLVGNVGLEAGLECTLRGPLLAVRKDARVAITGAPVAGLPWARSFVVRAGEELSLETIEPGCRAYLAVSGGFAVPPVLESRSTLLPAAFGGFEGRALRTGDRLGAGTQTRLTAVEPGWWVSPVLAPLPRSDVSVRVIRGPQADWFPAAAWQEWIGASYQVSARSDRMGIRLEGISLARPRPREMISEAVAVGAVQVPPDGQPIVLLADRQTIGGYPKLANVITADLGLLAQVKPGDRVRFAETTVEEARALLRRIRRDLAWLRMGIGQKDRLHAAG